MLKMPVRRPLLAALITLLLAASALAQVQTTHVTGTVVDFFGQPVPNARLTITKVIKGGVAVSTRPRDIQADGSGQISFDMLRNSTAVIEGPVVGFSKTGGCAVPIPDAATVSFESLVCIEPVPSSALTAHINALDPHPQYLTQAEADLLYSGGGGGPVSLDNLTDVAITSPATGHALVFDGSLFVNRALAKSDVGLPNVDNTSDANKPVSTAQAAAIAAKQDSDADLTAIAGLLPAANDVLQFVSGAWANRTTAQLKSSLALTASDVGLGNVDNTSDAAKNAAAATLTNKTISGASNTLTNVGNSSLTNSSVTIGSTSVSLGGTASTVAGLTLTTPTIASFTNATHSHQDAAGGGTLNAAAVAAGTLAAARMPALTGDVTTSAGAVATTISNDAVTYAKMQNVSAASKLLGRGDSGAGDPQEITLGSGLSMTGTTLSVAGGSGDVTGPASSVSGNAATFSGTTGKVIQDSGKALPSGSVVGTSDTQTLTNKTLTSPVINSPTGITKTDVGLSNVDNTSDANKPVSTATQALLPTYARVTGSDATTTGQTLVDVTGLSVALLANTTYEFEAVLSVLTSADTTGTRYGVNFSAAGATLEAGAAGTTSVSASRAARLNAFNTATTNAAFLTTSAGDGQVVIKGVVVVGANAGNLTIQHLKVTSGTSTVRINSFLKVTKIA